MGRLPAALLLSVLLSVLVLGGCGGSSSSGDDAEAQITAPAYNGYPAITIPVEAATPARCRHEARAFSREAVSFLAPFPSDSDTHLVIARLQFYEFKAHRCDRTSSAMRSPPVGPRSSGGPSSGGSSSPSSATPDAS